MRPSDLKSAVRARAMDKDAITGYFVINAKDMDEALEIAQSGPKITSTKVYGIRN